MIEDNEAVQLFIQSARRIRHDFTLSPQNQAHVIHICQLVAGMPLAIELAAAWVRVLSLSEIATEIEQSASFLTTTIRDVPERHRSLAAVFDYSWRLLAPEEQAALRKMAVFQGGFRRGAAETVAGADPLILASLADKSLLRYTLFGRYDMHPMICQYALEKLETAGEEEATRRRHAAHYLTLAETAEPYLTGVEQETWLGQLQAEYDNLRVAIQWTLGRGDRETAARLGAALLRFWQINGQIDEGRAWLERMLDDPSALSPPTQARALRGAGMMAWYHGDHEQAKARFQTSLQLFQELTDKEGVALVTNHLGTLALHQGHYEEATDLLQTSLHLERKIGGHRWGVASCLNNLGAVAGRQGDNARARRYYEESLASSREGGYKALVASVLTNLGDVADIEGDQERAHALYQESLALRRELGEKTGVAYSLFRLGGMAHQRGEVAQAHDHYAETLKLLVELGDKEYMVACLEGMACLATTEGRLERAGRLWGAAEAQREALGIPLPPGKRAEYEPYLTAARAQADSHVWQSAWPEGRQLLLEEAVEYALRNRQSSTDI
jgi:tetratricopeptide (TPR) repeat protein